VTLTIDNAKSNYQIVRMTNKIHLIFNQLTSLQSSSTPYPSVDILAVRPTTIDVCKHACQTLEIDLISIDLAETKTSPNYVSAQVAVNRGIFFEICYSQSFRGKYNIHVDLLFLSSNIGYSIVPGKKAAFFHAVKRLVEVTRGHNLIFSSEAIRALDIRRSADLKTL
jgi:ribonuclease P/MRP protein subunit RPP1